MRTLCFALLAPLVLPACNGWPYAGGGGSGSGASGGTLPGPTTDPPIIQDVSMQSSATAVNGVYTISGSLTYTDTNDVVSTVEIKVPVLGKTYDFPVADPVAEAVAEPFTFSLSADVPLGGAGPTTYQVILVNKSGAKSAPFQESVDLQ